MNRGLSFAIAALQALIIAAVALGLIIGPLTLAWLFEGDGSADYSVAFKVAAFTWFLAHGIPLQFSAGEIVGIEFPEFMLDALPLGLTALVVLMTVRVGHRLSGAASIWPAWLGGALAYGGIGFLLNLLAQDPAVAVEEWRTVFIPAIFFGGLLMLSSVMGPRFELFAGANGPEAPERVAIRQWAGALLTRLHWAIATVLSPAARAGVAVVAVMVLVSAGVIGLALGFGWIEVVRLYEGMRVSVLGGAILTMGQLALLPNLVVFGMAWISGVGFSIGAGSSVTPLATELGPLPGFPIFAALPTSGIDRGILFVLVPMLAAFLATLLVRRFTDQMRWEYATRMGGALAFALTTALITALLGVALALLASGSFGPGRFSEVGINAPLFGLVLFVEVAIPSFLAGLVVIRPYSDASQRRR